MYKFRDINKTSEGDILPSEALQINGSYIEVLIPGYRTLSVSGREALSPELTYFETGSRDGSTLQNKRYPSRTIVVRYQIIAKSNEEFREAYNKLAAVLNVEEAELIFNDEPDKFYIGTPSMVGEVEPGRNAVVGEFELFCADPFKYSVVEYEAEPEPETSTGSFLIDYNGTYKSYPTLEAKFNRKDGDCGYVAFFNEGKKIIQLGDPDEADTETYPKTQTLVNQYFDEETSWGSLEEINWATNGDVSYSNVERVGSVAMDVAHYFTPVAPSTSGTLLTKTSKKAKPYVDYKVTAKTKNRTATSIDVVVTINASVTIATNSGSTKATDGATVKLSDTKLYVTAYDYDSDYVNTLTGTYYLWDSSIINGKIRITNEKSRVGESGQVTGWVKASDISIGGATAATTLGKGYGLKGSIQIDGGDWFNVTIKKQSAVWKDNNGITSKITIPVKNIDKDTTKLENIKFKVERTDEEDSKMGLVDETLCKDLEISAYTAPTPDAWYLAPQTFGTGEAWHGVSITHQIPNDAAGDAGAKNFGFGFKQKTSIGTSSYAPKEIGLFQALIVNSSKKILAGITLAKTATGNNGELRFIVNGKVVQTVKLDLSYNNKYFGQDTTKLSSIKTSIIKKTNSKVEFNIGGIKRTFTDTKIKDMSAKEITFTFAQHGTKPVLSYNGIYWAKFDKYGCDRWEDIPNKFTSGDIVTADCKSGEVYLNNSPTPSLGALGNDWEDFYLTPGLNQIGFSHSDWVKSKYEPEFKLRYREVFI